MQHFAHEEGRVRLAGTDVKYDYFIKDHLGNTRMTLTEARDSTVYDATMETSLATFEESVFLNIAETRSSDDAFEGSLSARLGPESIGPAKMLVVSPGDTVDLSVYAQYASSFSSTTSGSSTNLGTTLAALFGATGGGATVYEQGVYNKLNNGAGTFLASVDDTGSSTVPKAYLNYIFFDQDFDLVSTASGYVKITASSEDVFDLVEANGLIMPEAGYLYVYLSNEGHTSDGGDVYFDVLRINHKKGHIIQEDHYYPFGLTINALSSSAPLSKPNKFKYNGKEEQTEFDLNWYDYGARMYDPVIGRWNAVDPLSKIYERHSPYNYTLNNPIIFIDPDGRSVTSTNHSITLDGEDKDEFWSNLMTELGNNGSTEDTEENGDGDKPIDEEYKGKTETSMPTPMFLNGRPNPWAYNCHSFAWCNSEGDPEDKKNEDHIKIGITKWDQSAANNVFDLNPDVLSFDEPNKVGDRLLYYTWDPIYERVDAVHSAIVTKVDGDGNAVEVESKWGQDAQYKHHPRDVPAIYGSSTPTFVAPDGKTYASRVYLRLKEE